MSATQGLNLSAELRDALNDVTKGIERSAAFVLLGESIGALPPDVTLPPAGVVFRVGRLAMDKASSHEDALFAEMRAEFPTYCISYAILAMTSACEEYLQRVLLIATLAALATQQQREMTGEQFQQTRDICRNEARQTSVDGLVPKILSAVRAETETVIGLDWFRGVYSMRKCVAHRRGRIGPDDVDENRTLDVAWRKPVLEVDGRQVVALPLEVKAGQVVSVGFADEGHSWRLGETISLTAEECQHIGLSLIIFCTELANLVQKAMLPLFGVQPPE